MQLSLHGGLTSSTSFYKFRFRARQRTGCGIYGEHFNQCRIFPLMPKDLEEIEEPCGYTFVESE
jgi:hypothetical protein